LRYILERQGAGLEGDDSFEEQSKKIVWEVLAFMPEGDINMVCLKAFMQTLALEPLEHYGIDCELLSRVTRDDVITVFAKFSPFPARIWSPITSSFYRSPTDGASIKLLACYAMWMELLKNNGSVELMKDICENRLPLSLKYCSAVDSLGYGMALVREIDLNRPDVAKFEEMYQILFGYFKESIQKLISAFFPENSLWWPDSLHNACIWAVNFMDRPGAMVDLEMLFAALEHLGKVSSSYRKASLTLALNCHKKLNNAYARKLIFKSDPWWNGEAESMVPVYFPVPEYPQFVQ
jgi:hypothetical protein